ncbi:NifU [Grosmannia clavigera kw1407]|uniref:NifU n=1 Tax=Grosmannia clavigera (strain kw1407 / UAMH 11150) TaxID=655863 RepID=F0XU15_GROCL|nr:NifU [Grosmannia clavigera kw1407]EFW98443.1 NifU [Grosmannia clavigera kw1407]
MQFRLFLPSTLHKYGLSPDSNHGQDRSHTNNGSLGCCHSHGDVHASSANILSTGASSDLCDSVDGLAEQDDAAAVSASLPRIRPRIALLLLLLLPVRVAETAAYAQLGLSLGLSLFLSALTESTPNADAIKFLPNHQVLPEGIASPFIEYLSPRATIAPPYPSPLAAQLMNVDGVTAVFYGSDFITVTKATDANWAHIRPEVFALITEAITSGQAIVRPSATGSAGAEGVDGTHGEGAEAEAVHEDSLQYNENDSEVVGMIKELLETRIRPAIQEDGGDIEFRGFEDGEVLLKLRGACRTCDSSTVTLKNGIESMLMHYIEEVKVVRQVLDQEEEVSLAEFAKFEEKLRLQKGSVPPSTTGKDTLDTVPG